MLINYDKTTDVDVHLGYYLEAIIIQTIIVSSTSTVNSWTMVMGIQIANIANMESGRRLRSIEGCIDYGP